ncbi:hypothetical protein [Bacillus cereus group sp. BfR-BA-01380]|uniref:hypothetical protein n=1 Tax=Bacillus cereus group sp. BfR-BA-01380 TaxID=2920324 RepID=UPI001F56C563|nr:hypothetical protein [Bacillus cereus group sp. BfR-BA-01380]
MKKEKEKEYVTYQIGIKRGDNLYPYFLEMCQNEKKSLQYNKLYIRQMYTATQQQEVLYTLQAHIEIMNENQLYTYQNTCINRKKNLISKHSLFLSHLFCFICLVIHCC